MKSLALDDTFKFGAKIDQQAEAVVEDDPRYIRWLIEEKGFDFGNDVLEALSKREQRR